MAGMEKYIIGILGIVALMVVWALVQRLWKKVFSENVVDSDVLAGRSDCGSCGCTNPCKIKQSKNLKNE